MKYMFLGDTHGDMCFVGSAATLARAEGVDEIIQVGDWGFLWPSNAANRLPELDRALGDLTMRFIDGNHDWHPMLRALTADHDGVRRPSLRTIYQARGSSHVDADGTRFLFLGGAPSIDRERRVDGQSWWPEEEITEEEVARCLVAPQADVMVCHDAPMIPDGFSDDVGSAWFRTAGPASREKIRRVVLHHQPELLVHGHWHKRYQSSSVHTFTVGLDCNYAPLEKSAMIWSRS